MKTSDGRSIYETKRFVIMQRAEPLADPQVPPVGTPGSVWEPLINSYLFVDVIAFIIIRANG